MLVQTLCLSLIRRVGAFLLGGVVLWQVAEHAGPSKGRAIIHVTNPRADLTVDDAKFSVESLFETPIVCELRPGHHTLRMLRGARVVYQEEFAITAGEDVILTAWDEYRDGRCPGQAD
jgi:hypothetical protein